MPGHLTRLDSWRWHPEQAADLLCTQFRVRSLAGFGCADMPAAIGAAGATLAYLERTNPTLLTLLTGLRVESPGRWVGLDAATRRNLELTRSHGTGGSRGSLLGVLDLTRTPMGARALRRIISQPLCDLGEICSPPGDHRCPGRPSATRAIARLKPLAAIGDLERLLGRVASPGVSPRDLLTLAAALRQIPAVVASLKQLGPLDYGACDPCSDVLELLDGAVAEEPSGTATIRSGFAPDLDEAVGAVRETTAMAGCPRVP